MAVFDVKRFLGSAAQGRGTLTSLGLAFGFPSCLLTLAKQFLSLIPSSFLRKLLGDAKASQDKSDNVIKQVSVINRWLSGIIESDTERGGFLWMSDTSKDGMDSDENKFSSGFGKFIDTIEQITQLAGDIYTNYENAKTRLQQIKDCIKKYHDYVRHSGGVASDQPDTNVNIPDYSLIRSNSEMKVLEDAIEFRSSIGRLINDIQEVLSERRDDPTLEPEFTPELCFTLSGLGLRVACPDPTVTADTSSVFRLVFGPPRSSTGQFILSRDGLYFDSQVSGLTPALTEITTNYNKIPKENLWKFDYNPNLGGRGDAFSTNDLNFYVNTILDPNTIDESPFFQNHYEMDGLLQDLIGQRSKRIYDLSAQIEDLVVSSASQSIIFNFKQSLMSENSTHQDRINKRKKQIELAIKLPTIYGDGTPYMPGEVPVNDFSYLEGINFLVDIQKQKALTLSQVDISGIVSPIRAATYVVAPKHTRNTSMEHLIIPDLAEGAIIYDGSNVMTTNPVVLDITNSLTTDSLFAIYNFLQTDVEDTSSTKFMLRNAASKTEENYGQLVSDSLEHTFYRGLGVPYLHGITKQSSDSPNYASGLGSYVKLPDTNEFNDLLYNVDGATIDFWAHVPHLDVEENGYDVNGASGLYRLVLSNENVGFNGQSSAVDTESVTNNFGNNSVRGFMMGFSRDRRLTKNLGPSNDQADNKALDGVFFIAPTQSVNSSAAGLINRAFYDSEMCHSGTFYHSMTYPIFSNGTNSFSKCNDEFCHISVTFDRVNDEVKFYLDGERMATSSMSNVFGIQKHSMPNIPNFKKSNSFEYNLTSVGPYASNSLCNGPKLNTYFTPWIVGGGYTDGMYSKGNFMGGKYGGIISGLKGYLGSLKFYKKPLSDSEVRSNYNTQRNFFKNIDTLSIDWGSVINY